MPEGALEKPRDVYVTYGGLSTGADQLDLSKDYIPLAFALYALLANQWTVEQGGNMVTENANLTLSAADLGRILKLVNLADSSSGGKKLDRDSVLRLIDPDIQGRIIRGTLEESPHPLLRVVLVKREIRKACLEVLREALHLERLKGITSVTEEMANDSGLRDEILDFLDQAVARLVPGENLYQGGPPGLERPFRTYVYQTLSKRRREAFSSSGFSDDLLQELLYPLAQAAYARSAIKRQGLYLSSEAQHDRINGTGTVMEILRKTTVQFVREILKDKSGGDTIFDATASEEARWVLCEEMIGRACNGKGERRFVDPYGTVEGEGSFSRQLVLMHGDIRHPRDRHLLETLQTDDPDRAIAAGHRKIINSEVNPVLRAHLVPDLQSHLRRRPLLSRFEACTRSHNTDEVEAWLIGTPGGRRNLLPGGGSHIDCVSQEYDFFARAVTDGVRAKLTSAFGMSIEDFVKMT